MLSKLVQILKALLIFYDEKPRLTTVLVVIVTALFAYLIFTSCTVTLSVQKNTNNSEMSSSSSATSVVDSTSVSINPLK